MDGSNSRADERDDTRSRRLPTPMLGAVAAAGAVSLGLVLIGSCGLGGTDTYVPPPPFNADLQSAPTVSTSGSKTTVAVIIPPSPTWRVASDQPPRRTPTTPSGTPTDEHNPDEPESPTHTTRPTTTRPTRTTTPRPTTERPTTEAPEPTRTTERPVTPTAEFEDEE